MSKRSKHIIKVFHESSNIVSYIPFFIENEHHKNFDWSQTKSLHTHGTPEYDIIFPSQCLPWITPYQPGQNYFAIPDAVILHQRSKIKNQIFAPISSLRCTLTHILKISEKKY